LEPAPTGGSAIPEGERQGRVICESGNRPIWQEGRKESAMPGWRTGVVAPHGGKGKVKNEK
jgi:hypothetical protein